MYVQGKKNKPLLNRSHKLEERLKGISLKNSFAWQNKNLVKKRRGSLNHFWSFIFFILVLHKGLFVSVNKALYRKTKEKVKLTCLEKVLFHIFHNKNFQSLSVLFHVKNLWVLFFSTTKKLLKPQSGINIFHKTKLILSLAISSLKYW